MMEQLTDQMILEAISKEYMSTVNTNIYILPIMMLVNAIIFTIVFILAKKDKNRFKNAVRVRKIALVVIIISLLFGCFFIAMGFEIKNDGVDSDWYVVIKNVKKVKKTTSDHFVNDIWVEGTPEWYMMVEDYDERVKINEEFFYKFKNNENLGEETKIYVVFNKNEKLLLWYDVNKYNYVGERLISQ